MQRITHNGTQVWPRTKQGRFSSIKSKIKYALRWLFIRFAVAGSIAALMMIAFVYGQLQSERTISAVNTVATKEGLAPVMERIFKAESGGHHYAKNGQVLMHINENGTVDIGIAQINLQVWGATATKLGYDLTKEADNKKFAIWLYLNHGTAPWDSSGKNWK